MQRLGIAGSAIELNPVVQHHPQHQNQLLPVSSHASYSSPEHHSSADRAATTGDLPSPSAVVVIGELYGEVETQGLNGHTSVYPGSNLPRPGGEKATLGGAAAYYGSSTKPAGGAAPPAAFAVAFATKSAIARAQAAAAGSSGSGGVGGEKGGGRGGGTQGGGNRHNGHHHGTQHDLWKLASALPGRISTARTASVKAVTASTAPLKQYVPAWLLAILSFLWSNTLGWMMPLLPLVVCLELPQHIGVMTVNLIKNFQERGIMGAAKVMIKDRVVQVGGSTKV
jgi:hypothetical protein